MSLITALDVMEIDCDLEDTADDEPSLGSNSLGSYQAGTTDDLELDNCDDEDGHDAEPDHDGETFIWSEDTSIPQEGPGWHGH
jgi:hypothetical protein